MAEHRSSYTDAVVALFVDAKGHYPELVSEWFDVKRDALTYAGDRPVVAHPPCQLWVNFAALNFKRYGGEHNRPGNDGGKFAFALATVRRCGGVREHPAFSNAWAAHDLVRPGCSCWTKFGDRDWTCEVWQSAYGHPARKRTWLYYSGDVEPAPARWKRAPGTHQCGWFDRIKPTLGKRAASLTPVPFAEYLIGLARASRGEAVLRAG